MQFTSTKNQILLTLYLGGVTISRSSSKCAVLTLELASLTAAPRLKAVISINDSLMTSVPTKHT